MKRIFRSLILSFLLIPLFHHSYAISAPPEEWHHQKTALTSLKSGWASNRHYTVSNANTHAKTNGCGLVHFELPPLFSASSFDRRKIKIALSLTTYLPTDFIHPKTGLEISSISPQWWLSKGDKRQMTVHAENYSKTFEMQAEPPSTWIAPIEESDLSEMLMAFSQSKEGKITFSSGEILPIKFGHMKSVLENFSACLAETQFAHLPLLQSTENQHHFF